MKKLNIALYGENGHQIFKQAEQNPLCKLCGIANISQQKAEALNSYKLGRLTVYNSLDELLSDESIDLVSICSPCRADQAGDIIKTLKSGKHVYAEKPAALSELELNQIISASKECNREFHEMATTVFELPFYRLYEFMKSKPLGEITQIYVQKSYKMRGARPQDDTIDGGLTRQVGIHAFRFIEHIVGEKIADIKTFETHLGNPVKDGGLYTASSCIMRLENGGVASACINYLNPDCFPTHGNETIRVFGTLGMAEVTDGGARAWVYPSGGTPYELPLISPPDFFDVYLKHILYGNPMPFELEAELHPLRIAIRAKEAAKNQN